MKNLILISAAFLLIGFQSCKEAETTNPQPNNQQQNDGILGTWNVVSVEQTNGLIRVNGVEYATYYTESSNMDGTVTFNNDGTMSSNIGYTQTMFMTIFGTPFEQSNDIPKTNTTANYTYDKNTQKLTIMNGGQTSVTDVTELTANKMVYTSKINRTETQGQDVSVTTADVKVVMTR